ncbi:peptidase domain-containing ABC transporter [Neisseria dentiae]|uniref:peptidase domain-containing ABC transporter n=1 Tax=Neisseria dentiae TaxID=194197 RepID=UPI00211BE477|nr:peptidase domain-containing ABC transporter [Neisseria dentiae]MCQ9327374.1 peptidase domain-containing ABC transporter [Neisseria dentiae]
MDYLNHLSFGFTRKLPVVLQTEIAECGLACLVSILRYHGFYTNLRTLRQKYALSLKGANMADIVRFGDDMNLTSRALRLELDELGNLRLPCILHWDLNHFVVLKSVAAEHIVVMDPATGLRKVKMTEVSRKFTGVALEIWPNTQFEEKSNEQQIKILSMLKGITGLRRSLVQLLLLAVAMEVFALVSPFFMQWVIDHVVVTADRNLLVTLALGFGLLILVQQAVSLLQSWVGMYFATTLSMQWKSNIFKRLLDLPTDYFTKRHLGDVVSRFGAADSIQNTLTSTFFVLVLNSLMAVFTLTLMLVYSPKLTAVVLVTLLIYILIRWAAYYPLRRATEENIVHAAKQSTYFMETIRGVQTVKQFGKSTQRHGTWMGLFADTVNTGLTVQKLGIWFGFANTLLFGAANILIVYLGALDILDGLFTVGVFMAFLAYKNQFESRIGSLINQFVQVKMLSLHGERLADIVLTETESEHTPDTGIPNLEGDIEVRLENVSFRYAENEPYVLQNVNLTVKPGESLALVGRSGCGKSTLLDILCGNLKPESGKVLINGHDIYRLPPRFIRSLSAVVRQNDVLFAGSIADNISFFDEMSNREEIERCARMAMIHDEISAMPMGYETLIGDMGSALSGGQKQRIVLARALYQNPKILFLDEATSHLDIANEKAVNAYLKNLPLTKIMAAHRKETVESADRVFDLAAAA